MTSLAWATYREQNARLAKQDYFRYTTGDTRKSEGLLALNVLSGVPCRKVPLNGVRIVFVGRAKGYLENRESHPRGLVLQLFFFSNLRAISSL